MCDRDGCGHDGEAGLGSVDLVSDFCDVEDRERQREDSNRHEEDSCLHEAEQGGEQQPDNECSGYRGVGLSVDAENLALGVVVRGGHGRLGCLGAGLDVPFGALAQLMRGVLAGRFVGHPDQQQERSDDQ